MNKITLLRILFCIFLFSLFLYSYTDQQNTLTDLRIRLPLVAKEIKTIREENKRLQYEIDQFENPQRLMELARHSEFSHLKHPLVKEVLTCQEGVALQQSAPEGREIPLPKPKLTIALGAAP